MSVGVDYCRGIIVLAILLTSGYLAIIIISDNVSLIFGSREETALFDALAIPTTLSLSTSTGMGTETGTSTGTTASASIGTNPTEANAPDARLSLTEGEIAENKNKVLHGTREQVDLHSPSMVSTDDKKEPLSESEKEMKEKNEIEKPLNIVLLYGDDWRHDAIGIAGTYPVHTPFLDRLSTEGIRFTHSCVTTSICWISRATLHTGQYLSKHKSYLPQTPAFYSQWKKTFPYLLKHKGNYDVAHVGKWHFYDWGTVSNTFKYKKVYYGRHWFPGNPNPIHVTQRNENDALEFLQKIRNKAKPFMLAVNFFAPHAVDNEREQYFPQNKSMSLYNNFTLRPPVNMAESWGKLPKFFVENNEGRNRWHLRFDNPFKYDKMLKNYFRLVSEIDATCGKIYDELRKQGILDETLIIFTTDNGLYHGEHGLAGKWYPHEESIRVPLIIRDPRMPKSKHGTVDDSFALNIDLYSTIMGAAQVKIPSDHKNDGRDIADIYLNRNGGKDTWRTEFYYEHPMHVAKIMIPESTALVRKDYKYFVWPKEGNQLNEMVEQLFHVSNDTKEEYDLINHAEKAKLLEEMRLSYRRLQQAAKT